jgi:hypothetical protein
MGGLFHFGRSQGATPSDVAPSASPVSDSLLRSEITRAACETSLCRHMGDAIGDVIVLRDILLQWTTECEKVRYKPWYLWDQCRERLRDLFLTPYKEGRVDRVIFGRRKMPPAYQDRMRTSLALFNGLVQKNVKEAWTAKLQTKPPPRHLTKELGPWTRDIKDTLVEGGKGEFLPAYTLFVGGLYARQQDEIFAHTECLFGMLHARINDIRSVAGEHHSSHRISEAEMDHLVERIDDLASGLVVDRAIWPQVYRIMEESDGSEHGWDQDRVTLIRETIPSCLDLAKQNAIPEVTV